MDYEINILGNFDEDKEKGINLVIKALSKKFPFIIGWELAENFDKYKIFYLINLIIDLEKVGEFYNVEMDSFFLKQWNSDSLYQTPYILTYSEAKKDDRNRSETKKIEEVLNNFYNRIPEKFSIFFDMTNNYGTYQYRMEIKIQYFQNKPTQNVYFSI